MNSVHYNQDMCSDRLFSFMSWLRIITQIMDKKTASIGYSANVLVSNIHPRDPGQERLRLICCKAYQDLCHQEICSVVPQVPPTSYFSLENFPVKTVLPREPCA